VSSLAALLATRLVELAGKAIGKGVELVGRKLLGEPEPDGTPLPWSAVEHQRQQAAAATSHKVKGGPNGAH
jgi:hypothetical protein